MEIAPKYGRFGELASRVFVNKPEFARLLENRNGIAAQNVRMFRGMPNLKVLCDHLQIHQSAVAVFDRSSVRFQKFLIDPAPHIKHVVLDRGRISFRSKHLVDNPFQRLSQIPLGIDDSGFRQR